MRARHIDFFSRKETTLPTIITAGTNTSGHDLHLIQLSIFLFPIGLSTPCPYVMNRLWDGSEYRERDMGSWTRKHSSHWLGLFYSLLGYTEEIKSYARNLYSTWMSFMFLVHVTYLLKLCSLRSYSGRFNRCWRQINPNERVTCEFEQRFSPKC